MAVSTTVPMGDVHNTEVEKINTLLNDIDTISHQYKCEKQLSRYYTIYLMEFNFLKSISCTM